MWDTWSGFKYSESGSIEGIADDVDLDYYFDSIYINSKYTEKISDSSSKSKTTEKTEDSDKAFVYTIKWGNTLTELADEYDTTVSAIVKANNIKNPNRIYIGQKIIIP